MNIRFHLSGSAKNRPFSRQTIFCDGSADNSYREGTDIELSHWVPNRTPEAYKADTSTEICMRFVESPPSGSWDLAVNNHADVDGILSVFALVEPNIALRHRETLVAAAEMGDFWGWGEEPAQVLFQGLTMLMDEEEDDPQFLYERCMNRIPSLLDQKDDLLGPISDGLKHLQASVELIQSAEIRHQVQGSRFVHYTIPLPYAGDKQKALHVPEFNEAISDACVLWPHARARWDHDKVALVSVEADAGWYYDLWYPGYMWADTPNRWRAPGLEFSGSANGYFYGYAPLDNSLRKLQTVEQYPGTWRVVSEVTPFSANHGRGFPIIVSFVDDEGKPAKSSLSSQIVAEEIARAFR